MGGKIKKISLVFVLLLFFSFNSAYCNSVKQLKLDRGLVFYNFKGSYRDKGYDIYILKIDPNYFSLRLLMSSKLNISPLSLRQWAKKYNLIAVINASMFWEDKRTSTGFMKNKDYINQRIINKKFRGFLVFNPNQKNIPQVDIIERGYTKNWDKLLNKYDTVIQNYRMIGENRKNLWQMDIASYSVSAIGIDRLNNVQFIFSYLPLSIHELNNILLDLPINIKSCIFTEGGNTSGMYIKYRDFEKDLHGYSRIDIFNQNPNKPEIPNVIGVIKKIN